jgi:hypothetical protein
MEMMEISLEIMEIFLFKLYKTHKLISNISSSFPLKQKERKILRFYIRTFALSHLRTSLNTQHSKLNTSELIPLQRPYNFPKMRGTAFDSPDIIRFTISLFQAIAD